MKNWISILSFVVLLVVLPALSSAQTKCVTFADTDCDKKVNFTEVIEYIDI